MNRRTQEQPDADLLVPKIVSAQTDHPDARLLALCAEICAIQVEAERFIDTPGPDDPDQAVLQRFWDRQEALARDSHMLTATTLEGARARARALVAWAPDYGSVEDLQAGDAATVAYLLAALLRDLTGATS